MSFAMVDIDTYCVGLDSARERLEEMEAALSDMHAPLANILEDFQEHTRRWMDSWGDGTYDPLSPSTIANKAHMGYDDPVRPLFATGKLLESASGDGPYTVDDVERFETFMGLDWDRDGWNIPALHQEGVPWTMVHRRAYTTRAGRHVGSADYMWHLPARPIFTIDDALESDGADHIVAHVFQPFDGA